MNEKDFAKLIWWVDNVLEYVAHAKAYPIPPSQMTDQEVESLLAAVRRKQAETDEISLAE